MTSDLFNNREIATGVWLVVAAIWATQKTEIREALLQLKKAFLHWKIIAPLLLMAGYLWLEVWLLRQWDLWNLTFLKDTVYWFLLTGFVLFMNLMGDNQPPITFFKRAAMQCIAVTVFLQFLLNLYTFPLWGELVFIPAITILVMMNVIAESDSKYALAKKLFNGILSLICLVMIMYSVRMIWKSHSELSLSDLSLSFLLPILLTLIFFPYLYVAKLIANYERFFVRLQFHVSDDASLLRYTRLKTLQHCHINLSRLDRFEKYLLAHLWDTRNREGINRIIANFKSGQHYEC